LNLGLKKYPYCRAASDFKGEISVRIPQHNFLRLVVLAGFPISVFCQVSFVLSDQGSAKNPLPYHKAELYQLNGRAAIKERAKVESPMPPTVPDADIAVIEPIVVGGNREISEPRKVVTVNEQFSNAIEKSWRTPNHGDRIGTCIFVGAGYWSCTDLIEYSKLTAERLKRWK
jgi:hypothetical protein